MEAFGKYPGGVILTNPTWHPQSWDDKGGFPTDSLVPPNFPAFRP